MLRTIIDHAFYSDASSQGVQRENNKSRSLEYSGNRLSRSYLYLLFYLRSNKLAAAALEVRHVPRIIGSKTAFNTSSPILRMIEKGLRLVNRRKKNCIRNPSRCWRFQNWIPRARRLQFMLSLLIGRPITNMIDGQQFSKQFSKFRLSDSSLSLSVRSGLFRRVFSD